MSLEQDLASAEKAVRDIRRTTRRQYSAEVKIRIVRARLAIVTRTRSSSAAR